MDDTLCKHACDINFQVQFYSEIESENPRAGRQVRDEPVKFLNVKDEKTEEVCNIPKDKELFHEGTRSSALNPLPRLSLLMT